mmetsp:Transcript_17437/g.70066  ORF Transcript_17437/g.70066 Transcript_17437/m.70066 type:complete len:408 (-) Transcript_17437:317-1540(-)|eukprot:CAMPEP_0185700144 /NCGR_PEP_ID=MMETSP1164-20130828/7327_1 /TAXON_ID=1104430 /ORGANISM="Chrysoreinhardia sp, Strain CCMP2950" /LENGTH=407 /DNA_ID=CAMNT_0028367093 /DNA_START=258 /DNA_END=1481 /DNA_ORIENTATION=+
MATPPGDDATSEWGRPQHQSGEVHAAQSDQPHGGRRRRLEMPPRRPRRRHNSERRRPAAWLLAGLVFQLVLGPTSSSPPNVSRYGVYNFTNTNFVMLKFHRVGSLTVKAALLHAVGPNHTYAEHKSLSLFRRSGVGGLVCMRPAKRVVALAIFREPVARFLSALNFVMEMHMADDHLRVPCEDRDRAWYEHQRRQLYRTLGPETGGAALLRYYLAYSPYSVVLNVTTAADVPDAITYLQRNFIVGTTPSMRVFVDRLTKMFVADRRATYFYERKQHFSMVYQGHVAPRAYCKRATLPATTVRDLEVKVGTDVDIYRAVAILNKRQHRVPASELPRHQTPNCKLPLLLGQPITILEKLEPMWHPADADAANAGRPRAPGVRWTLDYSHSVSDFSWVPDPGESTGVSSM